ncbi:MAG: hypothetical protein AABX11_05245 [Nanoarchaeota archaeon]
MGEEKEDSLKGDKKKLGKTFLVLGIVILMIIVVGIVLAISLNKNKIDAPANADNLQATSSEGEEGDLGTGVSGADGIASSAVGAGGGAGSDSGSAGGEVNTDSVGSDEETIEEIVNNAKVEFGADANIVLITSRGFEPQEINVDAGEIVVWVNRDLVAHSVVYSVLSEDYDSGSIEPKVGYSTGFTEPMTIEYSDGLFPSIKGKVIIN